MLGVPFLALARVPGTGPRSEEEQQPRVAGRRHLVALLGHPVRNGPDTRRLAAATLRQLDLALDDHQIRVLVDLVLLELLAGGQTDRDRSSRTVVGPKDLRLVRLNVERADVPGVHGPESKPLRVRRVARSPRIQACPSARGRGSTRTPPAPRC